MKHYASPIAIVVSACIVLLCTVTDSVYADTQAQRAAAEAMFYDDSDLLIDDVNEGELNFIPPVSDEPVLHSETTFLLSVDSFDNGWVDMQQCYSNFAPTGRTEVVYAYKNIRQLSITTKSNIGTARVIGQRIEMEDIGSSANICVKANVQVLEKTSEKTYRLKNGPYHRKFLDGYYPYHVTLNINYPENKFSFTRLTPASQPLLKVINTAGKLSVDTWFEGTLLITVMFEQRK